MLNLQVQMKGAHVNMVKAAGMAVGVDPTGTPGEIAFDMVTILLPLAGGKYLSKLDELGDAGGAFIKHSGDVKTELMAEACLLRSGVHNSKSDSSRISARSIHRI